MNRSTTFVGKSMGSRIVLSVLLPAALIVFNGMLPQPAAAAEPPPQLWTKCKPDHGDGRAGECGNPRGIVADPVTGNLFVAESNYDRISEFTVWGEVLRTFGWGVVRSGPNNHPRDEIQELSVDATSGTFALRFPTTAGTEDTSPIEHDANAATIQERLENLDSLAAGDVNVSGVSGGPWELHFTGGRADEDLPPLEVVESTLSGGSGASVTTIQGGATFETCVPADGDMCRPGQGGWRGTFPMGAEPGQMASPQGLALDASGALYVAERLNLRIQKLDTSSPQVAFDWMVGGGVNQGGGDPSTAGDICTSSHIANGDGCGPGHAGTGPSQFGNWPVGDNLAVDPAGRLLVGDEERIQRFDANGAYQTELALPDEVVQSLAVDAQGALFLTRCPSDQQYCLATSPQDATKTLSSVLKVDQDGDELCTLTGVDSPSALATDPSGDVYVVDPPVFASAEELEIVRYDGGACEEIERFNAEETGIGASSAIEASSTCGVSGNNLFVANVNPHFVRAYGPPPNPSECAPPSVPPTVSKTSPITVDTTTATVAAEINPHFWADATFHVEYGTQGPCSSNPCTMDESKQLGNEVVDAGIPVQIALTGLQPGATYHYRFVAESSGGGPSTSADRVLATFSTPRPETNCPNQAHRTGPAAHLPDCRAYEMVSPSDKNGGEVFASGLYRASPDGSRITFSSRMPFAGSLSGQLISQYLTTRDSQNGWRTEPISPPRESASFYGVGGGVTEYLYKTFTEDLCSGWVLADTALPLAAGAPIGFPNLYRRQNCRPNPGTYELLTTEPPPGFAPFSGANESPYIGAMGGSTDGARSVINVPAPLVPNACPTEKRYQIYLKYETGVRLVSVLPNGQATCTHSTAGTAAAVLGPLGTHLQNSVRHAISEDGSRIFWTDTGDSTRSIIAGRAVSGPGRLYLRINAHRPQSPIEAGSCTDPDRACTIPVSETVSTDPAGFVTATPDGTNALFLFASGSNGGDLYSFDVSSQSPTKIASETVGVAGTSDDLTKVYLVSTESLDAGAEDGKPNLYLWEAGQGHTFIATLAAADAVVTISGDARLSPVAGDPTKRASRVTSDGETIAFVSRASLTGYDNDDFATGKAATEVFRYRASTGALSCVSCNPSGARPAAQQMQLEGHLTTDFIAARLPGWRSQDHPGDALSADGNRVFFDSFDPLDPRDVNSALDVYQWQAAGSVGCDQDDPDFYGSADGCVTLITDGRSLGDSKFIDASDDGRDAFVLTRGNLRTADRDEGLDIYDARIGGGFPEDAAPPPTCTGDECQGVPRTPPQTGEPASQGQSSGNPPSVVEPPGQSRCLKAKQKVRKAERKVRRAERKVRKVKKRVRKAKRRARGAGRKSVKAAARRHRASRKRLRKIKVRARGTKRNARKCRGRDAHG